MPPVDFERRQKELEENHGIGMSERDVVSHALYPKVMDDYFEFRKTYGPVDKLDTRSFLVGPDVDEELNVGRVVFWEGWCFGEGGGGLKGGLRGGGLCVNDRFRWSSISGCCVWIFVGFMLLFCSQANVQVKSWHMQEQHTLFH